MEVTIGVSNRHVHVTEEDFKILFGNDMELEKVKDIHQPGQFASNQKVDVQTESGELNQLRILGPYRSIVRNAGIIADRHIHVTPLQRKELGLVGINEVRVRVNTEKGGTFEHVHIKEAEESYYEMHIDTDDANGFFIENGTIGEIIL